jgi:hypothetical protein
MIGRGPSAPAALDARKPIYLEFFGMSGVRPDTNGNGTRYQVPAQGPVLDEAALMTLDVFEDLEQCFEHGWSDARPLVPPHGSLVNGMNALPVIVRSGA